MSEPRRLGIVRIPFSELPELLDLGGNRAIDARIDWYDRVLDVKLEGPDMPVHEEGSQIEYVLVPYHAE